MLTFEKKTRSFCLGHYYVFIFSNLDVRNSFTKARVKWIIGAVKHVDEIIGFRTEANQRLKCLEMGIAF